MRLDASILSGCNLSRTSWLSETACNDDHADLQPKISSRILHLLNVVLIWSLPVLLMTACRASVYLAYSTAMVDGSVLLLLQMSASHDCALNDRLPPSD